MQSKGFWYWNFEKILFKLELEKIWVSRAKNCHVFSKGFDLGVKNLKKTFYWIMLQPGVLRTVSWGWRSYRRGSKRYSGPHIHAIFQCQRHPGIDPMYFVWSMKMIQSSNSSASTSFHYLDNRLFVRFQLAHMQWRQQHLFWRGEEQIEPRNKWKIAPRAR